ncbi:MAG: hypothetical protein JWM10_1931 [Myxococcaceae bacterium]|nr:hypothetical protein [Myxococcaceae bacterium]
MSGLFDKDAPVELRADSALTGSFVPSGEIDVSTHSMVTVEATYAQGDGDMAILLAEVQRQGSSAWVPAATILDAGTPGGGAVMAELAAAVHTISQSCARLVHVPVYGASRFRVSAKEAGATTPGTLAIVAIRSRVGA